MANSVLKEAESYFVKQAKFYGKNKDLRKAIWSLETRTGTKAWKSWDHIKGIVANIYAEHPECTHRVNNCVSKIPEKHLKPANELAIKLIDAYFDGLNYYIEEYL